MGLLEKIKSFFGGGENIPAQNKKIITIDTYSPVSGLISKKEMKNLGTVYVKGPARSGKGDEVIDFLKSICLKYNRLREINLSGISGLEDVKPKALSGCMSITKITLPEGVKTIGTMAFEGCGNLETIVLPEGVERIHEQALANCPKLTDVKLPKSLYRLGKEVFQGDDSLTEIVIPSHVESIGTKCFDCKNLEKLEVEAHNPSYKSIDNVLYSRNGSALVKYANGKKDVSFVMPEQVAKIGESAFENCEGIENITISPNTSIIAKAAFKNCAKLKSIEIPSTVEKIDEESFEDCSQLEEVKLSEGLSVISTRAFCNCKSLEKINIPTTTQKMGDEVFLNCSKLENIELPNSVEYRGKNILKGTPALNK